MGGGEVLRSRRRPVPAWGTHGHGHSGRFQHRFRLDPHKLGILQVYQLARLGQPAVPGRTDGLRRLEWAYTASSVSARPIRRACVLWRLHLRRAALAIAIMPLPRSASVVGSGTLASLGVSGAGGAVPSATYMFSFGAELPARSSPSKRSVNPGSWSADVIFQPAATCAGEASRPTSAKASSIVVAVRGDALALGLAPRSATDAISDSIATSPNRGFSFAANLNTPIKVTSNTVTIHLLLRSQAI